MTRRDARVLWPALAAIGALWALTACGGSTIKTPNEAKSPACTSASGFAYRAGACVTGSGTADIGPFTVPGPWSVSYQLSGQSASGTNCATEKIGMVLDGVDEASGQAQLTGGVGPTGTAKFPAEMVTGKPAKWHLKFDPSGCTWTVRFN
jgi:hypothetical protein